MNAYFCDAGRHDVVAEYCAGYPRYEPAYINDVVYETTPGKAKSRFMRARSSESRDGIEFVHVKTRLLQRDVPRAVATVASSADPMWDKVQCLA